MTIEFKLPEVSEGVDSVDIAEVTVSEGDVIEAGTVVCEVETDKAVAEIECPHAGKIVKLHAAPGATMKVGALLLEIEPADAAGTTPAPAATPPKQAAEAPRATEATPAPKPAEASPAAEPTSVEFCLPEVSEGIDSVDVAAVSVKPGDTIEADQSVCEVETDKAVAEINCPHAGVVESVHVQPGQSVAIGAPLLTIKVAGGGAAAPATTASSPAAAPTSPPPAAASTSSNAPATAPASPAATSVSADGRPPAPAGPATRRLARKLGVDLHQVSGTARGGRITIEDVEAYVRENLNKPATASSGTMSTGIVAAAPLPDFSKFGPIEKKPLNKLSRVAASNLHAAWVTIPHVTQQDLADITELEAARKRYVKSNPKSPKVTMTAIMIKAVVGALKAFPHFNSSIDMQSGELILKNYFHIGVAVDTPNGLVVPVIRDCDQKNVLQVASELTDIATRARDRKLKTEDMQGASFTITNLGGIGGTGFTPIVNYPEVAILGMSRGQKQLYLEDGQVAERLMLPLSLSYDHRAINGADAARFIVKLSSSLSNFFELF